MKAKGENDMKVLRSTDAFRKMYVTSSIGTGDLVKAGGSGVATMTGLVGGFSLMAAKLAAVTTPWAVATGWPVVGGLAATKVAAISAAAASAAASAALLPAALAGGGIACGIIAVKKMKKRTIQKGSSVSDLADAFARVAWLPMFAQASELCARSPQSREAMLQYVQKTLGDWGYSESYVQNQFDEAMAEPRDALAARYDAYMGKLKAGEVDEFDVSPEELPAAAVGKFAVEFRDGFKSCLMASAA